MKPATLIALFSFGALCVARQALPQVALPALRLPINALPLTNGLSQSVSGIDSQALGKLRQATISDLIRRNRERIEADPRGEPILRGQLVAVGLSAEDLMRMNAAGFTVISEVRLESLDTRVDVLRIPKDTSTKRALQIARRIVAHGNVDFDHLYQGVAGDATVPVSSNSEPATPVTGDHLASSPDVRIGLIDGGVQTEHPAFRTAAIVPSGCSGHSVPSLHGTAVASLMVGKQSPFQGAAPGATLYAADVYCGQPTGGSIDAIAAAMAWLSASRVPVINISLVGPDNAVLRELVKQMIARGFVFVAAVGNDGPAAPPLYPAAYPEVVGITAIDAHRHLLVEAERGPQVAFAAPGAEMAAAELPDGYAPVRGTSFAAPLVTGLLASRLIEPDRVQAQAAVASLAGSAIHMGSRGRNPDYGFGIVGEGLRIPPDIMQAQVSMRSGSD